MAWTQVVVGDLALGARHQLRRSRRASPRSRPGAEARLAVALRGAAAPWAAGRGGPGGALDVGACHRAAWGRCPRPWRGPRRRSAADAPGQRGDVWAGARRERDGAGAGCGRRPASGRRRRLRALARDQRERRADRDRRPRLTTSSSTTPSSKTSISISALSVSTTATMSPRWTASPGLTSHSTQRARRPCRRPARACGTQPSPAHHRPAPRRRSPVGPAAAPPPPGARRRASAPRRVHTRATGASSS